MNITLGQLGLIHEYGTTRAGRGNRVVIPPRPFLGPAMYRNREALAALNRDLLLKVVHGDLSKREALGKLGVQGQILVQQQIRETWLPMNAPATIEAKGSQHPLIDFGQMMENVQWEYEA